MSTSYKWIILWCAISCVLAITNVRDDANWFKKGNRLKDRFPGVVNGIFDLNCDETSNGSTVQGECMSKLECMKSKGKVGSLCSLMGVCCVVEKTCNETTSSRLSYFVSPANAETDCPLTIKIASNDVCQIRLDFEEFETAQPTSRELIGEGDQVYQSSYQCENDKFKVENVKKNLGFTSLCGNNRGQHIYIPISEQQNTLNLRFNLKDRTNDPTLLSPKWRIKIRQLECRRSFLEHHLNAPSKLMALYQSLKNKKHHRKSDYDLIAPPNCLQYYPEKTGQFESFNYNNGQGFYIGPMNYAICFRKTPDTCAIKYTSDSLFQMNYNPLRAGVPLDDRCHPRTPANRLVSQDYIRIHGGINSANEFKDYFCDNDFNPQNNFVNSKSVEPFFIGVNTDEFFVNGEAANPNRDDFQEIGFRLKYELDSTNCGI